MDVMGNKAEKACAHTPPSSFSCQRFSFKHRNNCTGDQGCHRDLGGKDWTIHALESNTDFYQLKKGYCEAMFTRLLTTALHLQGNDF